MSFAAARYLRGCHLCASSPRRLCRLNRRPSITHATAAAADRPADCAARRLRALTDQCRPPMFPLSAPPAAGAHMGEVTEVWLVASVFLNLKAEQTLVFSSHLLATVFPPTNPATCVAALNVDVVKFTQYNPALDFSATFARSLRVKDVTSPVSLLRSATLRVVDVVQPASPPPRFRCPVQPPPRARSFSTRRFTALQRPVPPTHACEGSFLAARALRVGYVHTSGIIATLRVVRRCSWRRAGGYGHPRGNTGCTAPGTGVAELLRPTLSYLNALYST
ncbi:hypothetical protein GGX14DRAFT_575075 [Mycena pura]|uniref:Uncharacterized protein n=1 Tax=Mycena pura TaxID=153505 RepID=A0AAD6UXY9_9AGAR|nr:hypothetical protein GGX14DRAFT_575075 [Mycena pura]